MFADRYNREEVVRSLGKEVNINPPLTLGQLPDTPEELLKLDQVVLFFVYFPLFSFTFSNQIHSKDISNVANKI